MVVIRCIVVYGQGVDRLFTMNKSRTVEGVWSRAETSSEVESKIACGIVDN